MRNGSPDDCYSWLSSTPNDLLTECDAAVRAERIYGFNFVGRVKNLPLSRRPTDERGCYVHNLFANDVKVGSWAMRMAMPFMSNGLSEWFDMLSVYIDENKDRIEAHLENYI